MEFPQVPPPRFGYCDSYFVDKHDDEEGFFSRAAADRERSRAVNRARSRQYAEELSRLTADEYEDDILQHMELMEAETMPDINSIEIQTEIKWFMRPYLLDFLLEAHHAFQLLPETLFLAVNLLDRYCSRRVVYKRHYQLVGCAALLIASKYGDRKDRVPTIRELKSMCCALYDDDMFTQMEWHVLQTINWIIGHPTVSSFIEVAQAEGPVDAELENMSLYLSEIALYHKEFIPVLPSVLARSSLALARCILNREQLQTGDWASRYDANVVMDLSNILSQPSQALFRKYTSPHLSSVSTTVEAFLQHQAMFIRQSEQAMSTTQQCHDTPMSMVDSFHLTPQTPQKSGYPHMMNSVGVMTPPITPDKGLLGHVQGYTAEAGLVPPQMMACVPTPPSSIVSHAHFQMPSYPPLQTQYIV